MALKLGLHGLIINRVIVREKIWRLKLIIKISFATALVLTFLRHANEEPVFIDKLEKPFSIFLYCLFYAQDSFS